MSIIEQNETSKANTNDIPQKMYFPSLNKRQKTFLEKLVAFFSPNKDMFAVRLSADSVNINAFFATKRLSTDDTLDCAYSAILDRKTFQGINEGVFRKRKIRFGYDTQKNKKFWGNDEDLLHVVVEASKQTHAIIQECLQENSGEIAVSRQQIHSLPQLCKHYLLSEEEIYTLCYILYDCPYIQSGNYCAEQNVMQTARHLCKERRHVLRLSLNIYASLVQQCSIVYKHLSIFEILTWINAISRMCQVVYSLSELEDKECLLVALYNIPRKTLIALSQGRTVDKIFLTLLREHRPTKTSVVQEIVIIASVARILEEQYPECSKNSPIPLLFQIVPLQYMEAMNPIFALLQLFRVLYTRFTYLLQCKTEYFLYALECAKSKHEHEEITMQLQEANAMLYALERIRLLYPEGQREDVSYSILKKLSASSIEVINFYGINPEEFFIEGDGFYLSLFPLLAYMQYNKIHTVLSQTAVIMKFIPLALYKHEEKPYTIIQEQYNTIIDLYPLLCSPTTESLEKILFTKIKTITFDVKHPYYLFDEAEKVVYALYKISIVQEIKDSLHNDIIVSLCALPYKTVLYIGHFPEIFASPWVKQLPYILLDTVYKQIHAYAKRKRSIQYQVYAQYISPLALLDNTLSAQEQVEHNMYEKACTLIEEMYKTSSILEEQWEERGSVSSQQKECLTEEIAEEQNSFSMKEKVLQLQTYKKERYTKENLQYIFSALMPLYYKFPLAKDAHIQLTTHVILVLEVFCNGSEYSLEELSKKSKSILKTCRKEQHTK